MPYKRNFVYVGMYKLLEQFYALSKKKYLNFVY